jgi:protoporphyrinogen oxidase
MEEWMLWSPRIGPTLMEIFFGPFHKAYTAGLYTKIAPQDPHKTPSTNKGYNVSFLYPDPDLRSLTTPLTKSVQLNTRVKEIDLDAKWVTVNNDESFGYDELLCTLPLNDVVRMTGLDAGVPDPHTSVLVTNVGAKRGPNCPHHHWLYIPGEQFHRVGFYSNIEPSFAPAPDRVSIYVEQAYYGRPDPMEMLRHSSDAVTRLKDWGWIEGVDTISPTFVPVAYTWKWPGSTWREDAIQALEDKGVHMMGRYGRWQFQGIMESIKEGLLGGVVYK